MSLGLIQTQAHSLPDSKALLTLNSTSVELEFHTPYEILELAFKSKINLASPNCLDSLKKYFLTHISISDSLGSKWIVTIGRIKSQESVDIAIGKYQEIQVHINLKPSDAMSLANFRLHSDLIIHQIPNQSIFVLTKTSLSENTNVQLGVISVDIPTGKIHPIKISLQHHSAWADFKEMYYLGMRHIREGTDHLLFILTLLLPSCLLVDNKRWSKFGGVKRSLLKLVKILTAFTIGHSITLFVGVLGWVKIPSQWVEVTIALSIVVSAVHAVRPIFYNKEVFIALGFGFLHGLAFSQTLQEFKLTYLDLFSSVLAFNLGIEAMQFFIMAVTMPWLLLISRAAGFTSLKNTLAAIISFCACGWIIQRITGNDNFISRLTDAWLVFSLPLLVALLVFCLIWTVIANYLTKLGKKQYT